MTAAAWWALAALSCLALGILWVGRKDLLHPAVLFPALVLLYFAAGSMIKWIPYTQDQYGLRVDLLWVWTLVVLALAAYGTGTLAGGEGAQRNVDTTGILHDESPWKPQRLIAISLIFLVCGGAAAWVIIRDSGGFPLLSGNVQAARFALHSISGTGLLLTALTVITAILLAAAVSPGPLSRQTRLALLSCALAAFSVNAGFASRSSLFWSIMPALVAIHYLRWRVKLWHLVTFGPLMVAVFAAAAVARGALSISHGAEALAFLQAHANVSLSRAAASAMLITPISTVETLQIYLNTIPQAHPFFHGALTASDWLTALPGRQPNANELTLRIFDAAHLHVTTGRPASLIGSLYAEYGVAAVIMGYFVLGYTLARLHARARAEPSLQHALAYGFGLSFAVVGIYGVGLLELPFIWQVAVLLAVLGAVREEGTLLYRGTQWAVVVTITYGMIRTLLAIGL